MATTKHSKQRDAIRNFLISRKDHPTAEVVYANVSKEFPNISLGTVYRNLSFLVDNGQAVKVPCDDGSVHFDGNVMPHYHFQCTECGAIIDLDFNDSKPEKALVSAAAKPVRRNNRGKCFVFLRKMSKMFQETKIGIITI